MKVIKLDVALTAGVEQESKRRTGTDKSYFI